MIGGAELGRALGGEAGDQPVKRIVPARARHQRLGEIRPHLPHHVEAAIGQAADEGAVGRLHQLDRPDDAARLRKRAAGLGQRMGPFGEIVVILALALPFEIGIEGRIGRALGQGLADPEPAQGGMGAGLLARKAAQPPLAGIVGAVLAQHLVHLADQRLGEAGVFLPPCGALQGEEIAQGKGVRPEVAPLGGGAGEAGAGGEIFHDFRRLGDFAGRGGSFHGLGSGPVNPALTVRHICSLNRRRTAGIVVLFQGFATYSGSRYA